MLFRNLKMCVTKCRTLIFIQCSVKNTAKCTALKMNLYQVESKLSIEEHFPTIYTAAGSQLHRLPLVDRLVFPVRTPPGVHRRRSVLSAKGPVPNRPALFSREDSRTSHVTPRRNQLMRDNPQPAALWVGLPPEGRSASELRVNFRLVIWWAGWRAGGAVGTPVEMACAAARSPADQDRWVPGKAGRRAAGLGLSSPEPCAPRSAATGCGCHQELTLEKVTPRRSLLR